MAATIANGKPVVKARLTIVVPIGCLPQVIISDLTVAIVTTDRIWDVAASRRTSEVVTVIGASRQPPTIASTAPPVPCAPVERIDIWQVLGFWQYDFKITAVGAIRKVKVNRTIWKVLVLPETPPLAVCIIAENLDVVTVIGIYPVNNCCTAFGFPHKGAGLLFPVIVAEHFDGVGILTV